MPSKYKLLNIEKPEGKTHEVEETINAWASKGWEVVGYSTHGWRGVMQAGFSHLILLRHAVSESEPAKKQDEGGTEAERQARRSEIERVLNEGNA